MNELQRKILQEDLDKTDSALSLEDIQSLSFEEAKLLRVETFTIWCHLNKQSYEIILKELKKEK